MSDRIRDCDLLLTGRSVATLDGHRQVIEPGSVDESGNRITALGTDADLAN